MRAISVKQPWASLIAQGTKTIETRLWQTPYRGDLLIVSTMQPNIEGFPTGQALCIVDLYHCRPMTVDDQQRAQCELYDGAWAWELRNRRPVVPVVIRGRQRIYDIDSTEIEADCENCNGCQAGCNIDGLCF